MRRVVLGLLNVPLRGTLEFGEFLIEPIAAGQLELSQQKSMEHHPVLSAIATAPVPQNLDDDRQVLSLLPIPQLELSLSFAERRFVEVGTIHFESFVGKSWEVVSRHAVYPLGGNSYGVSWHHGESHLQQFLTNAHQKLTDERWTEETGILLSLQLFRSTYRNSFAELEYLQTWTALEIIVSRLEEQKY